jgi:hypothetical protein
LQNTKENLKQNQGPANLLEAHKYAIHFDILPEISYLNQDSLLIIADLLQLFHQFPEDVRISQQSIDEGLDFCRVVFWVFSESSDALKTFGIWFQAIFRESQVANVLERLVNCALDDPNTVEVELTDWTRLHVLESDIEKVIQIEKCKNRIDM